MDVIAIRELEYLAPGSTEYTPARLALGKPEYDGEAWAAPYEIHGISPEPIRKASWGEDAVQALLLSFQIIYVYLERSGGRLTLAGREGAPWDHGLPPRVEPDPRLIRDFDAQLARCSTTGALEQPPPRDRGRLGDERGADDIAIMEFEYLAPGATQQAKARLVLRKPEHDGEAWVAPYEIHGISTEPIREVARGGDGVQALLLAFELIYDHLDRCGPGLTLAGCEGTPWDHGLPSRRRRTSTTGTGRSAPT